MDGFNQSSQTFVQWFNSQTGATFNPSIQLTDLRQRGAGRGIIATSDIPAETDLFTIPRSSVISVENSVLSKKLPKIFSTYREDEVMKDGDDEDGEGEGEDEAEINMPDPWLDLILVMVYEYLQNDASAWKQYFDVLPSSFDTLMFWGDAEVAELQASAIKTKIGKQAADEMFTTKVLPVVHEHGDVFYPAGSNRLSNEQLLSLAHRMGSVIMAYAFDLEKDEDEEGEDETDEWVQDKEGMISMGMVPMADMLNADAEFNAHLNHGEESLTMTSLRPIRAGEEILNYYGPLPNCDLLRRYGYTSAKHSRYDVVELPWDLIQTAITARFGAKAKLSPADDDEEVEESFVLERESGDPDETGVNASPAVFTAFPEELEEQVSRAIAPAVGIDSQRPDKTERKKLKVAFLETMAQVIPARLKQYQTSIPQDEELLSRGETMGRLRMAVDVRLGEKKLLREAGVVVERLLEKYREQEREAEQQPTAKRQKMSR